MKTHFLVQHHGLACGHHSLKPTQVTDVRSEVTCGNCLRYLNQRYFNPTKVQER